MAVERHPRPVSLALVSPPAADSRGTDPAADWSRLMAQAQDGDRQAYRTLLQNVTPYLRSMAARCFRQQNDIEDAVQDVLLTLHAVRQTYDPRRPFGPWLTAIARRRIIDRLRRETRSKAREIALSAEHETFSEPAANLESRDQMAAGQLKEALERLPPDQRQAVTLLKLDELSLKEAAAASGRTVASLKVATHRAIKRLRLLLEDKDRPL
jgi:RNA polymerase sigma-70 factor, ECF subfamily